ncbi:MAG TPA: DUF3500 domain-containing protein [Polyangia bacterium]|nr:DUF3500 domain-containing protein [Polyangia bacterium]
MGLAALALDACGKSGSHASDDGGASADLSAATDAGGTSAGCTATSATAANTAAVVAAAQALSAALTADQQTAIQYPYTLAHAQQWSNLPTSFITRNGVKMLDMSADAQTAAVALVTAATGSAGATLFSELRAADDWLVSNGGADSSSYGSGRYYFAFIGTPSTTSPWMLQVAGHHLAYNFTYNGACTSATPLFDGVEPTSWTDGTTTHAPLESQRAASVAVIGAVSSNSAAVLSGTFTDIVNGPTNANGLGDGNYPTGITYPTGTTGRGVLVSSLSSSDQQLVKTAIEAWVKNANDATSTALLALYESDTALASTYVGYSGATDLTTQNSYFRIDGPRVWIEVTIQGGIVYHNMVHYHTIWRDKASDYGAEFIDDASTASTVDGGTTGGTGPGGGGGPPDGGIGGPGGI